MTRFFRKHSIAFLVLAMVDCPTFLTRSFTIMQSLFTFPVRISQNDFEIIFELQQDAGKFNHGR